MPLMLTLTLTHLPRENVNVKTQLLPRLAEANSIRAACMHGQVARPLTISACPYENEIKGGTAT